MFLGEYEEQWLEAEGIRTRFFQAGNGPPIILIHGGAAGDSSGGANAEDWQLNFSGLARKFTVVAIDRLGQGFTDNPKKDSDYAMAASVLHVAAFMRAHGRAPYHVVGHSRGGYVAARLALDHPKLVTSCVIIDSNTAAPGQGRNEIVFALNPYQAGTLEASRWVYENYSHKTDHVTDGWIAMKQKITESSKNKQAIKKMKDEGLLHTLFLPNLVADREEFFAKLEKDGILRPVLIFWGYNDPTATLDQGVRLYELIAKKQPHTQMHIVNQAGHHSFRERAVEFNRVVAEFLEGVSHGD
jgi:2-hydroxy-6-oxonona-2,4-dienedioate hydrolase